MINHSVDLVLLLCAATRMYDVYARSADKDSSYFSRYDRNEYVKAQVMKNYNGNRALPDSSTYKHLKRKLSDNNGRMSDPDASFDDPNPCTTYLAPSSIPNSGLGMYTTIPYQEGEYFSFPEIGILLQDYNFHYTNPPDRKPLLSQYPWAATLVTFGSQEVANGDTLVPGLGMLANSHLGLANFGHSDLWWARLPRVDGTDTLSNERLKHSTLNGDVGRGATSAHGKVKFYATKNIAEGEEVFVNYGDQWFLEREEFLGVIPGADHYETADYMLQNFWDDVIRDGKENESEMTELAERYDALLQKAEMTHRRLRAAFPNDIQDLPSALKVGTARFSTERSYQSNEWLHENGVCIDKIVAGVSRIPQAGQGAFATRAIKSDDLIISTPVLTIDLDQILLRESHKKDDQEHFIHAGYQLLLNYCYGHHNSSLLFFPYSPSVNFINHGNVEEANAEVRWSTFPYHKSEWLDGSIGEAKERSKTGLMFDIIATKDIQRGEEILLYYGKRWEETWLEHVNQWGSSSNFTETHGLKTTVDLNQFEDDSFVKTIEEQEKDPYPENVMTRCYFSPSNNCTPLAESTSGIKCQAWYTFLIDGYELHPCDILIRFAVEDMVWYTVRVEVTNVLNDVTYYLVEYLPRYAIRFVDRPYSKDQFRSGAFRQMIELKDGVVPSHWMDR